jgi:hypothetical protein
LPRRIQSSTDAGNIIPTIITAHIAMKAHASIPMVRPRPCILIGIPPSACTIHIQARMVTAIRLARMTARWRAGEG